MVNRTASGRRLGEKGSNYESARRGKIEILEKILEKCPHIKIIEEKVQNQDYGLVRVDYVFWCNKRRDNCVGYVPGMNIPDTLKIKGCEDNPTYKDK